MVCLSSDGGYYYLRVHAMTVIALPFCFRLTKKVRENVGRYRIKSISLWRKDDFRNEELTRQTESSKASSVLQNGLFSFVMNGY